jgi:hypothetical protein
MFLAFKKRGVIFHAFLFFFLFFFLSCEKEKPSNQVGYRMYLKTGDIIFRQSNKAQHIILKNISNFPLNDCGIVEITSSDVFIWHIDGLLRKEEISKWLKKGANMSFIATRYLDEEAPIQQKFQFVLASFQGRVEDLKLSYESKALYNAEFVRKFYQKLTNTEITTLEKQYFYQNGKKRSVGQILTPRQLLESPFFDEIYSSFLVDSTKRSKN